MEPHLAKKLMVDITLLALTQVAFYYGIKYIMTSMDPMSKKKEIAKQKSGRIMEKLGLNNIQLNEHEEIIASEIIWPSDLKVTFEDIGGMENIIESLRETVIYPLVYPELYESISGLLGPPRGVLLYGPPGCGKTMTAKALAKESGATFINLHVSTMTDKWFGESQKLVHALFSLAKKLQPTIIFIDEIDSFLRERKSNDHEATSMMKAEFMTLWDGLNSGEQTRIIILGATNRPNDLDKAILRRMPKRFQVNLPAVQQRKKVLNLILKKIVLAPDFDMDELALLTEGMSNSDLKELCRNAVMVPVREAIRTLRGKDKLHPIDTQKLTIRPVEIADFLGFLDGLFSTATLVPVPAELD
ncbi:P-loop containing nucleoside triphosphate hydrolase protein [Globomyces pollinis-pini]|nr:P-loop containing nucleoside triphosphate hydrolase protein [Globomyces pollinis-pini]